MRINTAIPSFSSFGARLALCGLLLAVAGCASIRQPSGDAGGAAGAAPGNPVLSRPDRVPGARDYLIGPEDLLKIEVFRVDALSREVRVNATGQIALPLIGVIQAAGMTSERLAADIASRLSKDYLQNPQVIVFIKEYTSQRVTVVGAVKTPGVYPVKGRMTLLQMVASAGGPTSVADTKSVRILRPKPDGTRKMFEYDLADIREGRIPDPEILGEDLVQVDASAIKDSAKQVFEFVFPFLVIGAAL